jgi:hypothetical protein
MLTNPLFCIFTLALSQFTTQIMQNSFTDDSKPALIKDFRSLKTVDAKFNFWDKNLNQPYILFLFETSPYNDFAGTPIQDEIIQEFQDFIIQPSNNQIRDYNLQLIKEYRQHYKRGMSIELLDMDALKKDLEELESSKNKESQVQDYIRLIDAKITRQEQLQQSRQGDLRSFYFLNGYREKLSSDAEPDLDSKIYEIHDLIHLMNGHAFAELRIFLNGQSNRKLQYKESKNVWSIKEQLIALHYLGVLEKFDKIDNSTKKAQFLGLLLNKDVQNIRKEFSSINNLLPKSKKERPQAKKNLESLRTEFNNLGLTNIVKAIDNDLQRLDQ